MFRHFFINANTKKALEVNSHLGFYLGLKKEDAGAKTLGVKTFRNIKTDATIRDIHGFIKSNNLIRLSWYDREVGIDSYANPQRIFDIIKNFGEQYGFRPDYELTFSNNSNGKWFTILWAYFIPAMDNKSELIMRISNMDIKQELESIRSKIAGLMIASDVQKELKKNEDMIFEDLEKNVLGNYRLLKNFKAWVYKEDDGRSAYLDKVEGSATVPKSVIERIFEKHFPAFGRLSPAEKKSETDTFLKSFKTLPIEDVKIKADGDLDKYIKYVQANWVLTGSGLLVKVDERKLKNLVEEL